MTKFFGKNICIYAIFYLILQPKSKISTFMKKKVSFLGMLLLAAFFLSSCGSALQFTNTAVRKSLPYGNEQMEFLGFKNSYTTDSEFLKKKEFFRSFGNKIEGYNIAVDRSDFYTGVYSFAEMERYHATKRYISFIEVLKHQDTYDDSVGDNKAMLFAGSFLAGFTLFTLVPVYVPLMVCSEGNKCMLKLHGEYKLYVYDTEKKEIVYANPFSIDDEVLCKGQYSHKKTDREAVREYTETVFFNALLDEYQRAYNYLEYNNL